jgi:LPS export ABC transporter protein LptC
MTPSRKTTNKRARRLLVTVAVVGLGIAAAVYLNYRRVDPLSERVKTPAVPEEGMIIAGIHQSATRDGRTEWSLDAVTGQYLLAENKILLRDLTVTFFTKTGRKVFITAKRGTVMTDTHDMEAEQDVVARNDLYRLETEKMRYQHESRLIEMNTPVKISGQSGEISGDSLAIDLNSNRMVMKGHVQGILAPDGIQ